jgi:hypothetical protein
MKNIVLLWHNNNNSTDKHSKCSLFFLPLFVLRWIHWVNRSWTETKETTIVTWFRDAGFPLQCPTEIHSEEESDLDDIPLAQLTLCGSSRGRNWFHLRKCLISRVNHVCNVSKHVIMWVFGPRIVHFFVITFIVTFTIPDFGILSFF